MDNTALTDEDYMEQVLAKLAAGQRAMLHEYARLLCGYREHDQRTELEALWDILYTNAKARGYGRREAVQIALVAIAYVGMLMRITKMAAVEARHAVRH